MDKRKIPVAILMLDDAEFRMISDILENSNKALAKTREKSKEKRKTDNEISYRRNFIHLCDYVSGEAKMRLSALKKAREDFQNKSDDDSCSDIEEPKENIKENSSH
jgi:hypothetical protein